MQTGYGFLESDLKRISWVIGRRGVYSDLLSIWIFSGDHSGIYLDAFVLWCKRQNKNLVFNAFDGIRISVAFYGGHATE